MEKYYVFLISNTNSKSWKQLIQSRGRSFLFSAVTPVPLAATTYASVVVAEPWHRMEVRQRMQEFYTLTGIPVTSQILSIIVGSPEKTVKACQVLLESGIYVVPILGPPVVPLNTGSFVSKLRVALTAAHTTEDIKRLVTILSDYVDFPVNGSESSNLQARL